MIDATGMILPRARQDHAEQPVNPIV